MSRCRNTTWDHNDSDFVMRVITSGLFYFPSRNHILREHKAAFDQERTDSTVFFIHGWCANVGVSQI